MSSISLAELASAKSKILHISDLHFGMSFDDDSWTDLKNIAAELKPNILLVTGDLVNSPHRIALRRAFNELAALEKSLETKVIVVPGNHDTRFLGILPIKWASPYLFLLVAGVLSTLYWLGVSNRSWIWLYGAFGAMVFFLLRCWFIDFNKRFQRFILPRPGFYKGSGFEIYAFDSATHALFGARGRIPKKQFVDAHGNLRQQLHEMRNAADDVNQSTPPYRIAILHHHPLPIPYDDVHEPLMVADNAGTFLSEVSRLGVRLVLHGHKHHRHFSRTTINASTGQEHEIAILSTGTPTRGAGSDGREHCFYFLRLVGPGDIEVTPFVAPRGGAFQPEEPFSVEESELADERLCRAVATLKGKRSNINVLTVEISPDGDLDYRREFYGFKILQGEFEAVTQDLEMGTGHIDDFSAGPLQPNSPYQIRMQPDANHIPTLTHRKGEIVFGRQLNEQDPPVDFYSHYYACNAFAMSVEQHRQMYASGPPYTENIQLQLQDIPASRLDVIIKYPAGFKIDDTPVLLIQNNGQTDHYLEKKLSKTLAYYPHLNVAVIRISFPPINVTYMLQWTLTQEAPPAGGSSIGSIDTLAKKLLQDREKLWASAEMVELLELIDETVRDEFELDPRGQDPLDISLMVYDKSARTLRIVAASFPVAQDMIDFQLKYGDGIAGRAYKMNRGRMFIKRLALDKNTPSYYYPIDGKPYDLADISDEVIISLPLRHPDNEQLVYAVLNLSSRYAGSRLQDIKDPRISDEYSKFLEVINIACFQTLSEV